MSLTRRGFLKASAIAGGGFLLEMNLGAALAEELGTLVGSEELNAYVKIASDGEITIYSAIPEMGQGIKTALPMIVAEEMGAKWEDVTVLQSEIDERFGAQGAGGSTSIPRNFDKMRRMGASAREMLIGAASESLEVPREELEARESKVIHVSGQSLTFGQLAALAVRQPVPDPDELVFRPQEDWTILGTSVVGVDNLVIATGRSAFGIDTIVPNMQFATYMRCPKIGGKAVSFNEKEIKSLPGITDAFILEGNGKIQELRSGVAIVGEDTWAVLDARNRLDVKWDDTGASDDSWDRFVERARRDAGKPVGNIIKESGNVDAEFARNSNRTHEAFYEFAFVAHVCMEPMNCTASYVKGTGGEPDTVEVWAPSQAPARIRPIAQDLFGLEESQVTVHQTRMGGGFGRRFVHDFAAEAMAISERTGTPIKLTWTRTDDMHHDFFRAGGHQNLRAAVDGNGKLVAWEQQYFGFTRDGQGLSGSGLRGGELPLTTMKNVRARQSMIDIGTPCGPWRAPGSNTNAFVEQCFIHELAEVAGRDHLEFLLEMFGEPRWLEEGNIRALNTGRAMDVIKLAAEKAGWGKAMPAGSGLGLAFYFSHAGHIAECAEVSVDANKNLKVHKVTVAVDVGPIINMSGATTQVQGSVIDGLSALAAQKITMQDGVIQQDNFDEYPVMRIGPTPAVDVHYIQSDYAPTGIGEPALPPLAPAVANAIYAATGERVRTMPLSELGYRLV